VFDPLAVLLLIAAQYTFDFRRKEVKDETGERLRLEQAEYESLRAQRIVDNIPPNIATPTPPAEEEKEQVNEQSDTIDNGQLSGTGDTTEGTEEDNKGEAAWFDRGAVEEDNGNDAIGADASRRDDTGRVDSTEQDYEFDDEFGDIATLEKQVLAETVYDTLSAIGNKEIPDTKNRMFYPEELEQQDIQKKSIKLSDESRLTEEQINELDTHPSWQDAKQRWKDDHPTETLKDSKMKYLHGIIDKLPWEDYLLEPHLTEPKEENGYIQNQEQTEKSIWKNIGDK
jgi:hypothetical protein